jgi:hypothetical protein
MASNDVGRVYAELLYGHGIGYPLGQADPLDEYPVIRPGDAGEIVYVLSNRYPPDKLTGEQIRRQILSSLESLHHLPRSASKPNPHPNTTNCSSKTIQIQISHRNPTLLSYSRYKSHLHMSQRTRRTPHPCRPLSDLQRLNSICRGTTRVFCSRFASRAP